METKIILHRAYKGVYPENSITAFRCALREGLDTEIDIRRSKDGVPVVIHDESLKRLFNSNWKVKEHNFEYMRRFNYLMSKEDSLSSLNEFCEAAKQEKNQKSRIFVHIKELRDVDATIQVIDKYRLRERVNIFAVDDIVERFIEKMREKHKEYSTGLYLPEDSKRFSKRYFKEVDFIWADEVSFKWIDREKTGLAHKLGKSFYAVSPELVEKSVFRKNIEERWGELIKAGVDGICTDAPRELAEFLKRY